MADARWNRAKQVFHEAIEKSGPDRARYVAASCGDDRELRAQVEGLLAAHAEAGDFMASPTGSPAADEAARAAASLAASGAPEAPGTVVGPYKLLQVIGEGGFGIVYMAEQEHPIRRRVALKIIKLGMDTKEVIARFEAERQALAMMDHPNIAKVFDAGATESGRPYFVMELVKGVPITDYCDANHLSTRERLDLFSDVCKAIHHAHEKGIIHRDIKPSNVMVTLHDGTPVPKIIDFGVAKATNQRLTEKTLFTAYGQFVGTPAYMSPEQTELSGLEIDRRSDVYSLGVLLYELLTGTTPFEAESLRSRAFIEVLRIIREDDPPTPSARLNTLGDRLTEVAGRRQVDPAALQKLVRGDLDWIAMKALDKDRRRRYSTASDLADDINRYYRDEPVTAHRPSAAYRLQKFARRRRGMLLATASTIAAIVLGGVAVRIGAPGVSSPYPVSVRTRPFTETDTLTHGTTDREFLGLSPDGTKALVGDYAKGSNLAAYDLLTRKYTLLTHVDASTEWTCCGAWSARNDAVAFVQGRAGTAAEVRVTSLAGQSEIIFRDEGHIGRLATVAGWFPDGSKVLLALHDADGGVIGTVPTGGGAFTAIVTWKGASGYDRPALSPDGQFIAFAEPDNGAARDLHIVRVDGTRRRRVTEHAADDSTPVWSPDGRYLAFLSNRAGSAALWTVAIEGGEPVGTPFKIRDGIGFASPLNWNARGIVFSEAMPTFDVFTSERAESTAAGWGTPRLVPYESTGGNFAPKWSPSGSHLAFIARDAMQWSRRHVIVKPVDGGVGREYLVPDTPLSPGFADLRWFRNGKGLGLVGAGSHGEPAVYRLALASSEWAVVPLNTKTWAPIEWNDDGSACYFVRTAPGAVGIYERVLETARERPVYRPTSPVEGITSLRVATSKPWLGFTQYWKDEKKALNATVVVLNLATGQQRTLTTIHADVLADLPIMYLAWTPGDSAIVALVIQSSARRSELRLLPLDGSGVRTMQEVTFPSVSSTSIVTGFDLSSDGRRLAFVVRDDPVGAVIVENPLADAPAATAMTRR